MIAINWGTSNFRAYKLDAAGNVEAERSSARGAVGVPSEKFLDALMAEVGETLSSARGAVGVPSEKFLDALMAEVGDWVRDGERKVLMSGMVGARNGWKEALYVSVPATFDQVVDGVIR